MSLKLNMLPPSVNNMSVRVFVRAAGLPFEAAQPDLDPAVLRDVAEQDDHLGRS